MELIKGKRKQKVREVQKQF